MTWASLAGIHPRPRAFFLNATDHCILDSWTFLRRYLTFLKPYLLTSIPGDVRAESRGMNARAEEAPRSCDLVRFRCSLNFHPIATVEASLLAPNLLELVDYRTVVNFVGKKLRY